MVTIPIGFMQCDIIYNPSLPSTGSDLMGECGLCHKSGEDVSLLGANHKELGNILICRDCWKELYQANRMVAGSTCGGKCSTCCR
jgi:hypothetical protein